jgi:hypothetical protein
MGLAAIGQESMRDLDDIERAIDRLLGHTQDENN